MSALPALQAALNGEPFDYHAYLHQQTVETLRLGLWCSVHEDLLFFCDHKHKGP